MVHGEWLELGLWLGLGVRVSEPFVVNHFSGTIFRWTLCLWTFCRGTEINGLAWKRLWCSLPRHLRICHSFKYTHSSSDMLSWMLFSVTQQHRQPMKGVVWPYLLVSVTRCLHTAKVVEDPHWNLASQSRCQSTIHSFVNDKESSFAKIWSGIWYGKNESIRRSSRNRMRRKWKTVVKIIM